MSSRMAGATLLRHLGPRLFVAAEPASGLAAGARGIMPAAARIFPARMASTEAAAPHAKQEDDAKSPQAAATPAQQNKKAVVSYWGIEPRKLVKDDGTEWPWFCFRPWDTYRPDTSIDVAKHLSPGRCRTRWPTSSCGRSACPGPLLPAPAREPRAAAGDGGGRAPMVGGAAAPALAPPLRAQRRLDPRAHGGGRERAHAPDLHGGDAAAVVGARARARRAGRLLQRILRRVPHLPKFAHRFVSYLEEEAVESYTEYLKDLEAGDREHARPAIAIDYWRLPADARLRTWSPPCAADEAHHRDANHYASDIHYQGLTLNQTPAPLGYH
ncbi:hypothetical protein ZWY2020_029114 [Hordeum vulgare]|nr:hypothetical protein ZWY2020_029114 [Hordeum vulgare]